MLQLVKDNFFYLLLVIAVLIFGINSIVPKVSETFQVISQANEVKSELNTVQSQVSDLRMREASKIRNSSKDGKKIYELEGAQFSPEASFAPLFEIVLGIAKNSGIRIRSIEYNYQPETDPVYMAHLPEYNVCELSIIAVGSYTQIQNFYKGIMKEQNLAYLSEVELTPWEKDKSILISKTRIRLYTKTPSASSMNSVAGDSAVPGAPALP